MKNRYILQAIGILIFFCIIALYGYLEFSIEQWIKKTYHSSGYNLWIASSLVYVLAGAALGLPKYVLYKNSFDFKLFLLFLIPGLIFLLNQYIFNFLGTFLWTELPRPLFQLVFVYGFFDHPVLASLLIGIGISRATIPVEKKRDIK